MNLYINNKLREDTLKYQRIIDNILFKEPKKLLERKEYLTNECDKLRSKIEEDKYVDKDKKTKLEEAQKQYEALLNKGLIDIKKNTINI